MKKLFSISVFALVMLTACQNANEDVTVKNQELSSKAVELVKMGASGQSSRLNPNDAFISCHDDYNHFTGNACVYVDGNLFNVTWITMTQPGGQPSVKEYSATHVSSCGC
ncbi:hypothetical protein SAMN05421866_4199 [Chryseobacterium oranimense]|uniref:Lipoprotein n=1 Tax=Chryseobacterium oranimense TaxID=421058 RepID=A0A1M5WST6_9FLAO|nr:hypothetical protein [Chryseobacterium oranimense]SHH90073.1 hypothetical protein SAMN05421866_4199 [Chryseobacterium oranimense]